MTAMGDGAEAWIGCRLDAVAAAQPQALAIVAPEWTVAWAGFHRRMWTAAAGFHARGVAAAIRPRHRPADLAALFTLLRPGAAVLCLDPEEPDALNAEPMRRASARFHLGDADDPAPPGMAAFDAAVAKAGRADARRGGRRRRRDVTR